MQWFAEATGAGGQFLRAVQITAVFGPQFALANRGSAAVRTALVVAASSADGVRRSASYSRYAASRHRNPGLNERIRGGQPYMRALRVGNGDRPLRTGREREDEEEERDRTSHRFA